MDISVVGEVILGLISISFGFLICMFLLSIIVPLIMFLICKATGNLKDEWKDKDMGEVVSFSASYNKRVLYPAFASFYCDKCKKLLEKIKG